METATITLKIKAAMTIMERAAAFKAGIREDDANDERLKGQMEFDLEDVDDEDQTLKMKLDEFFEYDGSWSVSPYILKETEWPEWLDIYIGKVNTECSVNTITGIINKN